jgi:hypothetical protein
MMTGDRAIALKATAIRHSESSAHSKSARARVQSLYGCRIRTHRDRLALI